MADSSTFRYDVFISYAKADQEWVTTWLLPRLEQAGLRVAVDFRDFVVGMPRLEAIENAVRTSRRTIVLLTPEWLADEWNAFEALLLRSLDPAARRRKLLPVVLRPCELPDELTALERADLTSERHWERQIQRLTRDVVDQTPVDAPWRAGKARDWGAWRRWMRRYRRELRLAALGAVLAWVAVSTLFGLWPFHEREGWRGTTLPTRDQLVTVAVADGALLASGSTESAWCATDVGLWRSAGDGTQWQPVRAPLCFKDVDGDRLAAMVAFASSSARPARVYAATSNVGLLRSDDGGRQWTRLNADSGPDHSLPDDLINVASLPADPETVFAAGLSGGLFRSRDGGQEWVRLDGIDECADGEGPLPADVTFEALLAIDRAVYVGTGEPTGYRPGPQAGIYASRDGRDCWERTDNGEGRYEYVTFAQVPGKADQFIAVTKDFAAEEGTQEYRVWLIRDGQGRVQPALAQNPGPVTSVYVEPGQVPRWYAANWRGEVTRGTVDGTGEVERLPTLTRCFLRFGCDLMGVSAGVGSSGPLLYSGNRVYRLGIVKWYQRLWP